MIKSYHKEDSNRGESWTHFWTFMADFDEALAEEKLIGWARERLLEVETEDCAPEGSGIPGAVYHSRPYVYFRGSLVESRTFSRAVCVIAQRGGYDI